MSFKARRKKIEKDRVNRGEGRENSYEGGGGNLRKTTFAVYSLVYYTCSVHNLVKEKDKTKFRQSTLRETFLYIVVFF